MDIGWVVQNQLVVGEGASINQWEQVELMSQLSAELQQLLTSGHAQFVAFSTEVTLSGLITNNAASSISDYRNGVKSDS